MARRFYATLLMALMAASCSIDRDAPASEAAEVQQAFDEFIHTLNNLEWDRFQALIAEDVTVFNPAIPSAASMHILAGRQEVLESFESIFDAGRQNPAGPVQMVVEDVRIATYSDAAVVTFEFPRGPEAFGRRTAVFGREAGVWRVVHIHASNVSYGAPRQ